MSHISTIIYLTGKPGVGKYTIAKELSKNNSFGICDNQLINNSIFELLHYDGYSKIPGFAWESIAKIRTEIFEFLIKVPRNSYVLTNNLYQDEGDENLYEKVKNMAEARGSLFVPVRLLITEMEHLKRITDPNRRERWKSIDPQEIHNKTPLLNFTHPNFLELEVSNLSPREAADCILKHIHGLGS